MVMVTTEKKFNIKNHVSMKEYFKWFIAIGIILILTWLLYQKNNQYQELEGLVQTTTEELQLSKNERGELVAKIGSFETQRTKDFVNFATRDSLTLELQKEVKEMSKYLKKQGSVTQVNTEGNIETSTETEVEVTPEGDPIYKSKFNLDGWVFGNSVATKDSTYYNISYKDKYSIVIGIEPTGFLGLGKGKPFGQVTSSNPYNTVKTLKTYQVGIPKTKRWSVGPSAGLQYYESSFKPYVGVGITFGLIQF